MVDIIFVRTALLVTISLLVVPSQAWIPSKPSRNSLASATERFREEQTWTRSKTYAKENSANDPWTEDFPGIQPLDSNLNERFPLLYSLSLGNEKKYDERDQPTSIDLYNRFMASDSVNEPSISLSDRLTKWAVMWLAVAGCVSVLNQALLQWDWMQTLRYAWPFSIGALFVNEGWQMIESMKRNGDTKKSFTPEMVSNDYKLNFLGPIQPITSSNQIFNVLFPFSIMAAGLGLIIGGAADAWLPVYVTGPNLLTAAGLAPDSAAYLMMAVTFWGQEQEQSTYYDKRPITATNIFLLAQLYILGAGSFDDVATQTTDIISRVVSSVG